MSCSDEDKVERKSRKRKSKCREKKGDGNHDPSDRKDRLLRAARRFVQDHNGREKNEKDGSNLKKSRKHHRESRRRSCDSEEEVSADERSKRRNKSTGRCRERRSRGDEKRSRQFRSNEKHKKNGKEYHRQSGADRRSEDVNDDDDDDDGGVNHHDDTHDDDMYTNEQKQSGRGQNSDRNRHQRKNSRDPKDNRKRRKEKRYTVRPNHETNHSPGAHTFKHKHTSHNLLNQNIPVNKVALHPIGPIVAAPPKKKIHHEKDYFSFHSHLRLYLYRTSGAFFEDLKASQTRSAFAQFCQNYNQGHLEEAYYTDVDKLHIQALQQCKRTRHAWNFKTTNTEQRSLKIIKAGVQKQTDYDVKVIPQAATSQNCTSEGMKATITPRLDDVAKKHTEATREDMTHGKQTVTKREIEQRTMLKMLGLDKIKTGQKITIAPREEM